MRPVRLLALGLAAVAAACGGGERGEAAAECALSTPGASWLAFCSNRAGSYDLYVARADGSCLAPLSAEASQDLYPSWSPAGVIAFASDRGGRRGLWLHDLATGVEAPLAVGGLSATSPAFSPDGALVAFEGRAPGTASADVYLVPAAGGEPVRLTDDPRDDVGPAWAPDGASLYFVSTRTGAYEVFSVRASGGPATQVTDRSRIVGKPAASPDGTALVFARTVAGTSASEVVRLDLATGAVAVTSSQDDSEPVPSPDGSRLALRSFRHGQAEILLVDPLDGGHPFRLTQDPASDGAVTFAPLLAPSTTRGRPP